MLSVTILVKNGERKIQDVLQALQKFDEIVLFDTGSTDRTLEIARGYPNVVIFQSKFEGFGAAHNAAAALAKHDWILSVDSDEVASEELVEEILQTKLDPQNVYDLPFHNYLNGKHIKWCGWHPESHIRLYHRKMTQFSEALVHEGVVKKNLKVIKLTNPLYHYSYGSISDFLIKMERYTTLFAKEYRGKRKSSPMTAFLHGTSAFLKSFILKRGFLGGFEGYLISVYNAQTAYYKYLKLYQENKCS